MKNTCLALGAAAVAVMAIGIAGDFHNTEIAILAVPPAMEIIRHAVLLLHAKRNNGKIKTSLLIITEIAKFIIVAAAVFMLILLTSSGDKLSPLLYCVSYIISQAIGTYRYVVMYK